MEHRCITDQQLRDPESWAGGYFELALELGPRSDSHLHEAALRLWQHPSLAGPYSSFETKPEHHSAPDPRAFECDTKTYGIASIPNVGATCCSVIPIREDEGPDWLVLCLPMGGLSHVLDVGAYPFDDGGDLDWRTVLQDWLRSLAESVFQVVPFERGLIDHEVSGEAYAADLRANGIPVQRWMGYLWPEQGALRWFPPTEGPPMTLD